MWYKTSFFNPTLGKHNLRRFWPLSMLIFVVGLFLVTNYHAGLLGGPIAYGEGVTAATVLEHQLLTQRQAVYSNGYLVIFLQFVTAPIASLLVMHHIHGRKQIQFYHGLPLSRRCFYLTSVISGYLMALIPMVLAELCMIPVALSAGAEIFPIFQLLGITISAFTLFYSLGILSCTLAGQGLGALCLYVGTNFVFIALSFGGAGIARYLLSGFDDDFLLPTLSSWLSPLVNLMGCCECVYDEAGRLPVGYHPIPFLVYAGVGLGILVGTGFFYQHRKGEMAGEMIAFPFLRGVCKTLVALVMGLGGTVILVQCVNPQADLSPNLICLIILALVVLGWMAAEMVIRKTFRVFDRKALAQCGGLLVLTLVVLVGTRLDVLGYVDRIPELSEISCVYINQYGTNVRLDPEDGRWFHALVLENQQELSNNTSYQSTDSFSLTYQDSKGKTIMTRRYYVVGELDALINIRMLEMLDENPEYNGQSWFFWQGGVLPEDAIRSVEISSYYSYMEDGTAVNSALLDQGSAFPEGTKVLTTEQGRILYQAVLQDIQAGNLQSEFHNHFGTSQVTYGDIQIWAASSWEDPSETGNTYYYLSINENMAYTLSALENMGITVNPEYLTEVRQTFRPDYAVTATHAYD